LTSTSNGTDPSRAAILCKHGVIYRSSPRWPNDPWMMSSALIGWMDEVLYQRARRGGDASPVLVTTSNASSPRGLLVLAGDGLLRAPSGCSLPEPSHHIPAEQVLLHGCPTASLSSCRGPRLQVPLRAPASVLSVGSTPARPACSLPHLLQLDECSVGGLQGPADEVAEV
jgi:hypothetical protein